MNQRNCGGECDGLEGKEATPEERREAFAQVHGTWSHADHPDVKEEKGK